jgi:hypothetical protein
MNKLFSKMIYTLPVLMLVLSACSDDGDPKSGNADAKYVILSAAVKWDAGYLTSFNSMPTGIINEIADQSLQVTNSFGFRSYKNWIFSRKSTSGDVGLQKYTVNEDGTLKDEGFIVGATQFLVVDDTKGYYLDETRSTMKLQAFNPTLMQRTGEVDLSSLRNTTLAEYQVVGKHTIAAKEGKLYAGVTYGTITGAGFGDDVINHIEFAVIDIATNTFEKTIKYDLGGLKSIGWGSSGNKMWTVGDDGALYFYSTGLTNGFTKTSVIRIKKGETDFDKNWRLDAHDLAAGSSIVTGLIKNGKMYLELPSEPLVHTFANLQNTIFEYYVVDLNTKVATKITGMPKHHYAYANEQAITEIDGKIMFWVRNTEENIDGYYSLNSDGTSTTQVFNIEHTGFMWGLVKLQK